MTIPHHPVRKYRLPPAHSTPHNRCDVEVQRTRRAAGRHDRRRTTDEGDTHHGPAQRARVAPHHRCPARGRQRV
ncbi:hypothetical protein, partial [Burkholderia sp. A2]|uniref:hypothetical protein n=1 Tax=Burkholderia sp. A2 TaxID=236253 RepID=UPI001C408AB4